MQGMESKGIMLQTIICLISIILISIVTIIIISKMDQSEAVEILSRFIISIIAVFTISSAMIYYKINSFRPVRSSSIRMSS